ncbi:universal stress protein [Flindersiella endophytica]
MERGVVVGVDGTTESWEALRWAAHEALARDCSLRVVHVYRTGRRATRREDGHDIFDAAVRHAHSRLDASRVSGALVAGDPVSVLLAESAGAELLVVGSRQRTNAGLVPLESVSAALAWRSDCPVLIARGEDPWRTVVAGIREPETGAEVLEFAFQQARERFQGLSVVHCASPDDDPFEDQLEQSLAAWVAVFHAKYPETTVTTELVERDPVHTLVERSHRAGLVVVGTGHHIGRLPTSSICQRVLDRAGSSVAVVREQRASNRKVVRQHAEPSTSS